MVDDGVELDKASSEFTKNPDLATLVPTDARSTTLAHGFTHWQGTQLLNTSKLALLFHNTCGVIIVSSSFCVFCVLP